MDDLNDLLFDHSSSEPAMVADFLNNNTALKRRLPVSSVIPHPRKKRVIVEEEEEPEEDAVSLFEGEDGSNIDDHNTVTAGLVWFICVCRVEYLQVAERRFSDALF